MKKRALRLRKKNVKLESRRQRMRLLLKSSLAALCLLAVAWAANTWLPRLKLFSLENIVVFGQPRLLAETDIIRLAGLRPGASLFATDLGEIQARIQQNEFVKAVSVQRHLPHTLVIEVKEHVPEFILNTGRFYYLDEEGEIFKDITDTQDSRDYPVLSGFDGEMILTDAAKTKEAMRQAIELKKIYRHFPFADELGLSEIHYEKNIGFTLYPEKKKYSIRFGLKDFSEKTKKLAELLEKIQDSNGKISSIDLNYPGKVLMTL